MKTLVYIICGAGKPCKWVRPIKEYHEITENKKCYLCEIPVSYEELDHRIFTADKSEIALADLTKATGTVGDNYRIPNEFLTAV